MTDNKSFSEQVAEEIRVLLTRRKKSGRQLAIDLGVTQTWMSTRLNGSTPIDLNELARIAEALNVEVADLLPPVREGRLITASGETRDQRSALNHSYEGMPSRSPITGYPSRTQSNVSTRRPGRILQSAAV